MKKWICLVLFLLPFNMSSNMAFAQPEIEKLKAGIEANLLVTNGSQVPYEEARIAALKRLLDQVEFVELNQADQSIMRAWADEARVIIEEGDTEILNAHSNFCDQLDESPLPLKQQIAGYEGAIEAVDRQLLESYETALSKIDNISRLTLESYLEERLIPTVTITKMDMEGLVDSAGEESAIALLRGGCMARDPEVRREVEQRIQQRREDASSQSSGAGYLQAN